MPSSKRDASDADHSSRGSLEDLTLAARDESARVPAQNGSAQASGVVAGDFVRLERVVLLAGGRYQVFRCLNEHPLHFEEDFR